MPCNCGVTPARRNRNSSAQQRRATQPKKLKEKKKQSLRKMAGFVKLKVYLPAIQPSPGTCPRDVKPVSAQTLVHKRSQMLCS